MDRVWKSFTIICFLVIIYICVWIDPTTISNRQNIEIVGKDSLSVNETNTTLERKRRDYIYRTGSIRSVNESYILTRKKWKTKRRFKDENNRSKPLIYPVISTTRKTQIKTFDVRNGKRTKATQEANLYDTSKAPMENKTSCTYYFDKGTLAKARQTLSLPNNFMLYYININTRINFTNSSPDKRDDLLHWQYILKGEQFLVQLPVDIDLITFGLLFADHEETVIELTLYSNSNCSATITDALEDSIRSLLWNELFGNNNEYYLCNRKYESEILREIQYAITTIWVGYDLSCWSSKDDPTKIKFEKDRLPLVAPVLSYLLSFHFIWIFVVLDMGNITQHSSNTATVYYKRNDRPFGLKRFFTKILHGKYSSCCESSYCTPSKRLIFLLWLFILLPVGLYRTLARKKYSKYIYEDVSSVLRLSEPFFYACGNGRAAFILDIIYATFMPIFFLYFGKLFEKSNVYTTCESNSTVSSREQENTDGDVDDENIELVVDILLSPCYRTYEITNACIGLKCCCYFYHKGCLDCEWTTNCCCFEHDCKCYSCKCSCEEEDCEHIASTTDANARCSYCYHKDCLDCGCAIIYCCYKRNWICSSCKCRRKGININAWDSETNARCSYCYQTDCSDCECTMNYCKRILKCSSCNCRCEEKDSVQNEAGLEINNSVQNETNSETNNCCIAFCRDVNDLISCPFPVHHLVCELAYTSAINVIDCLNNKCCKDQSYEPIGADSNGRNLQNSNDKQESTCITYFLSVIIFIILWIVLRPVISTFTFIIRSFTYFVFVTLPTREHIMRYTLIAVTTVTQFSKYLHEVINMNQEILDYIFERKLSDPNNDHIIEEETFNHIYWELKFVKRTLYFLILKMFIVFMYIFITIETLITYPKSLDGSFQDIVGFLLLIIGPYAISLFFKANQENFLSDENKREIDEKCCYEQL